MSHFLANPINNIVEKIRWQLLPAALFLLILPFNHTIALRFLCLFLAAAIALRSFIKQGAPPLSLKLPLALWAGIAALSLTWSLDPMFSLNELKTEIGYGMIALFSFFILTSGKREWHILLWALMAGVAGTATIAAVKAGQIGIYPVYELDWQHGPGTYSTYLSLTFPFLLYLLLRPTQRRFPFKPAWLLLPIFLFAGYSTINRMFWLAAGAAMLVFLTLLVFNRRKSISPISLASLTAVLAMAAILFVNISKDRPASAESPPISTKSSPLTHVKDSFLHSERYQIWRYWSEHIAERPLTGVGFGRDLPHYVYAKPPEWQDGFFAHGHNVFLNYALQMGLPGLVALLILLAAMIREFWHFYRSPHDEVQLVGICGLALIASFITKNMTDDFFWRSDGLLFWSLVGMLLGYGTRSTMRVDSSS